MLDFHVSSLSGPEVPVPFYKDKEQYRGFQAQYSRKQQQKNHPRVVELCQFFIPGMSEM